MSTDEYRGDFCPEPTPDDPRDQRWDGRERRSMSEILRREAEYREEVREALETQHKEQKP